MVKQPTRQLLVRLPDDLARRLKRQVPARGRSAFVQQLLEQALAPEGGDGDPLYRTVVEVERDEGLAAEMAEWDGTVADDWERKLFRYGRGEPSRHGLRHGVARRGVVGGP